MTFDSVAVGAAWAPVPRGQGRQNGGKGLHLYILSRCRLRQQRVDLLPGRLGRDPAQDRGRHVRDRELQRGRRPSGQEDPHPRRDGDDHRPGDHRLEI